MPYNVTSQTDVVDELVSGSIPFPAGIAQIVM
jgi:hypothetical protein